MSKPKVFVAKQIPVEVENYIGEHCEYEKWDSPENIPQEELLRRIADKEGILLSGIKIDDTLLNHAPNLKVVSSISVGYNNYDLQAMKAKGVFGTNTPYVLDDSVADLIVGLILTSGRRLAELDRYVKDGRWMPQDDKNLFGVDVHHSTVGIIGMGR
ncbi:MAG: NAD(P)-dependent oxidoreductase, partial [Bacillota bacterium]|nr:NAD(P)-dependent oxidoreductase [Bacillota bacterium]